MRLQHEASEDPRDKRVIEGWVRIGMKELMDSGKSASTTRQLDKAVKSFFEAQNLDFNMRAKDKPKVYHNGQRVILKDQIRTLYDRVGEEFRFRNRAFILFLKDSGLRLSDALSLDVGDYINAKVAKNKAGEPFKVFDSVKTVKTGSYAFVHIGPEAISAVDVYLHERKEKSSLGNEGPLFIDRTGKRLETVAASTFVYKVAQKLENSNRISAHSLRKHFQTALEGAGIAKNWIGKYQGRVIGDSTGPYSKPEDVPGQLTETYIGAYHALRIFGEQVSTQQIDEQADRIAELEAEVARLTTGQNSELEALCRRVDEQDKLLKLIYDKLEKAPE